MYPINEQKRTTQSHSQDDFDEGILNENSRYKILENLSVMNKW
jgi:hypothetical protein